MNKVLRVYEPLCINVFQCVIQLLQLEEDFALTFFSLINPHRMIYLVLLDVLSREIIGFFWAKLTARLCDQ